MANDELTLGAEFPSADQADWLKLVDKVLDGAPFDRKLVTTTYDGLRVQPLDTRADSPGSDAAGAPGAAPFVRGGAAAGSVLEGWDVRQYHAGTDLTALNAAILTDLERGVRSIVMGPCGITTVDELDRAPRSASTGVPTRPAAPSCSARCGSGVGCRPVRPSANWASTRSATSPVTAGWPPPPRRNWRRSGRGPPTPRPGGLR